MRQKRVSVKAGTPPGTPGTPPGTPGTPGTPPGTPGTPPGTPGTLLGTPGTHPEPHPEHAGIRAMKQRTCFSINSRVSH